MLHEKPNEFFHWKNKLDALDHLPGEPLTDKMAAWEKLHDRIGEKPRNKKIFWYWAAAACLLLVSGITWFMVNEKDNNLVKNDAQQMPANSPATHTVVIDSKDTVNIPSQALTEKKQAIAVEVKNKDHRTLTNNDLKVEPIETNADTIKETFTEIMANTTKRIDTIAIVAAMPVKQKLRVVHINELGNAVEEKIQFSRNSSTPFFQTNLTNQNDFSSFSVSRNASDNIIKINLAPSN